ncbi:hypothetical protein I3843_08G165000 [Carya illinoinensis]|nr:hypothetical protein I3843_08G165000 [Carya illinoinensis]
MLGQLERLMKFLWFEINFTWSASEQQAMLYVCCECFLFDYNLISFHRCSTLRIGMMMDAVMYTGGLVFRKEY